MQKQVIYFTLEIFFTFWKNKALRLLYWKYVYHAFDLYQYLCLHQFSHQVFWVKQLSAVSNKLKSLFVISWYRFRAENVNKSQPPLQLYTTRRQLVNVEHNFCIALNTILEMEICNTVLVIILHNWILFLIVIISPF